MAWFLYGQFKHVDAEYNVVVEQSFIATLPMHEIVMERGKKQQ